MIKTLLLLLVAAQIVSSQRYTSFGRSYWVNFFGNKNNAFRVRPTTNAPSATQEESRPFLQKVQLVKDENSTLTNAHRCKGTGECIKKDLTLVCIGATYETDGYCLPPLKPMQHGCKLDDQCKKACPTSFCSSDSKYKNDKGEKQCRCKENHYYLFNKCWKRCISDMAEPGVSDDGTLVCRLKEEEANPAKFLRRFRRQIRSGRIIC